MRMNIIEIYHAALQQRDLLSSALQDGESVIFLSLSPPGNAKLSLRFYYFNLTTHKYGPFREDYDASGV